MIPPIPAPPPSAAVRVVVRQACAAWHRTGDARFLAIVSAFASPRRPTPGASRRQSVNVATPSFGFNDGAQGAQPDVEGDNDGR